MQVCKKAVNLDEIFTSLYESIDLCKDAVLIQGPANGRELMMDLGRLAHKDACMTSAKCTNTQLI